jgi:uncharacterized protein (DUF2062 family)
MKTRLSKKKSAAFTKSLLRFLRYWYLRLVRLQGHPREIARGIAAGVFSGCFPWFGLQIAIALLVAIAIRGNKLAAAAATWISNPFTDLPIFIFNYKVGEWLLSLASGSEVQAQDDWYIESAREMMDLGFDVFLTTMLGSLFVGLVLSFLSYFLSLALLKRDRPQLR